MRIIVVVGRVLDPRGIVVNRRAGRVFVNREEYVMQPADRCALEAALHIKDDNGAEVVVLPRGTLPDDDVLRLALATGADRAICWAVGGPETLDLDDAATVRLLVATVERLGGADLALTGSATLDTGQGQLGPRLAEALGWPQILGAWHVQASDGRVRAVCQSSAYCSEHAAGYVSVEASLPCVVTVPAGSLKPRYPDGARLVNIYKRTGEVATALEQWAVADLVDPQSLRPVLERRGQEFPPERERGARVSGTPDEMARAATQALRQRVRV